MPKYKKFPLPPGTKVPNHVAIIPDGNRRWARAKGLHTFKGHKAGFDNAVDLGRAAREWGIHTVTLWGFSTDNWDRTPEEINYLMKLFAKLIDDYIKEAKENKVRIYHLGRKDRLPKFLLKKITEAEEKTSKYDKFIMNIALDYGGRDELLRIFKNIIKDKVPEDKITSELIDSYSDLKGQPYPNVDLMIRTSGEQRTSGYLLWHADYNEFYFTDIHFPDFGPEKFMEAVLDYSRRRRRFGGNDAMEHLTFKPALTAKLELAWWRLSKVPEGVRFRDFVASYVKEQYGFSKSLARDAAKHLLKALIYGKEKEWEKAKEPLKEFYELIKNNLKLAFEPEIVTNLKIDFWKERESLVSDKVEDVATDLLAEEYRLSTFQAKKAAHLRVLAERERDLALQGVGGDHWNRASDYLEKYYEALKERVA